MANTVFMSNNQVNSATITAVTGTTSTQFPLSNIQLDATTSIARVTNAGNIVRINIEMAADTSIDTIAITGSNLTGLGLSNLTARTSLTSDFTSSTDITVSLNSEFNFGYAFYTARTARFIQLEITGVTSTIDFANIYIGTRTTLTSTYSRQGFVRTIQRNDEIAENIIGNRFVNILNARDIVSGTFPIMERANFLILEGLMTSHGGHEPIWVMLDQENNIFTDGEFKLSLYSYFNNVFSHDLIGGGYFNVQVDLIEVV